MKLAIYEKNLLKIIMFEVILQNSWVDALGAPIQVNIRQIRYQNPGEGWRRHAEIEGEKHLWNASNMEDK